MEVILLATMTLDGFIAKSKDQSSANWTSKADLRWFVQKTKEIGVCIMGKTTFNTIGKPLRERQILVLSSSGKPIEELDLSSTTSVSYTNSSPQEIVHFFAKQGRKAIAICGGASVYTQFLQAKLITKLFLTIHPILFGEGVKLLNESLNLNLDYLGEHQLEENLSVKEYKLR